MHTPFRDPRIPASPLLIIAGAVVAFISAFFALAFLSAGVSYLQIFPVLLFLGASFALAHSTGAASTTQLAMIVPALPVVVFVLKDGFGDPAGASPLVLVGAWILAAVAGSRLGVRRFARPGPWTRLHSAWALIASCWLLMVVVAWRLG